LLNYQDVLQEHFEDHQEVLQVHKKYKECEEWEEDEEQDGMSIDSYYVFVNMLKFWIAQPHTS
jgi:hypothetical protein